ncbi:unnamed protein product [Brassica rapa]|uniref:Uncharacterized protein n=1 Tax=Brassica campestris TaxID=3711 RepID=A0A8D9MGJ8_BRACM|nr:unnamed protein product [Brassica rapa]
MKGKFCLVTSLLVLSLMFSSSMVSAQPYQSRKLNQTGKQIHIHEVSKTQVSPSNSTGAKGRISR